MFCPKCGKQNDDQARFCQHCGVSIHKEPLSVSPPVRPLLEQIRLLNYAGFWNRFAANSIDGLICGVAGSILFWPFNIAMGISRITTYPFWLVFNTITSLLMYWLYSTLLESSSKQATIGKMAVGIIVTDLDGEQISFGRANGRWWGKFISFLIIGIGYIMAGFTQKKQALHDIMADTLVLKKSEKANVWVTTVVIIVWILTVLGIFLAIAIPLHEKYRSQQAAKVEKFNKVTSAVSNVASAVMAYHEDLDTWPIIDGADVIAIRTSLGVSMPHNLISSVTITSPRIDEVIITATVTGIAPEIDGKTLTLTKVPDEKIWYWGGTVPHDYIPKK